VAKAPWRRDAHARLRGRICSLPARAHVPWRVRGRARPILQRVTYSNVARCTVRCHVNGTGRIKLVGRRLASDRSISANLLAPCSGARGETNEVDQDLIARSNPGTREKAAVPLAMTTTSDVATTSSIVEHISEAMCGSSRCR
jgi:hypothetical protein